MEDLHETTNFSLIVCTYSRADSVIQLMDSVATQSLYPNEILIIDASEDDRTEGLLSTKNYKSLLYYKVAEKNKGLTKQRNFGIGNANLSSEIICFLDDDIVLEEDYFKNLMGTYKLKPGAVAVGGRIVENGVWRETTETYKPGYDEFEKDGYVRKLGSRNVLRKKLGLLSNKPPGFMPEFSHGFSTGFLPPTGKIYPVEFFMGGVSSFRREIFEKVKFSEYFEGYGLYEDMDFCLRASKLGELYVNTSARVFHLHHESGRPDYFRYGKMVVQNGYYVWKLKYPDVKLKSQIKWYLITILLTVIRLKNGLFDGEKIAVNDFQGRIKALLTLRSRNSKIF
ncbi:glycosyltransferase family 2 protein [Christiangramia sabulilitoris]|uniref:Glycosyltransferase family 2 protein n=1 Tax=Christiangramia sabulilitoris TaxID=2583991 RepID=A0A550HZB6_9FLAO|nr:glycosyltransferase family 2 protein [Christiangramia sabulilitoris]TRO63898.1 glycosyltransferase family 2 protein [Christiangramia sabulilitoris]